MKNLWEMLTQPNQLSTDESKQLQQLKRMVEAGLGVAEIKPEQMVLTGPGGGAAAGGIGLVQGIGERVAQDQMQKVFGTPQALNSSASDDVDRRNGKELAALLLTIFYTKGAEPALALGYDGPRRYNKDKKLEDQIKSGRVNPIDQKDWLANHSAMKIPSQELMQYVYIDRIFNYPTYHFGRYPNKHSSKKHV